MIKSGIKVVGHPQDQQTLQAIVKLTSKQTKFLSSLILIAKEGLNNSVQKVQHEMLSEIDGLKEALKCRRFINMNKTTEKPNPFEEEECDIAAGVDKMIRNAIFSFASKRGASLKIKMLDVKKPHMLMSVMSAKKAKEEFTSTPQPC